jgi:trans-aconitate 2-methyltransferase
MTESQLNTGQEQIAKFYDEFREQQSETGVNLRHFMVFDQLKKAGLRPSHNVFEIGCGIGTFTGLIARHLNRGKILATDISPRSIEIARSNPKMKGRVEFIVSDMKQFDHPEKFDFVIMIDVLEHIPFEQYDQLFSIISRQMNATARLAINIPHPEAIEFLREHSPEKLQIIDNPVQMDYLAGRAYAQGLEIISYHPYKIFHKENDFVFMTFMKKERPRSFTEISRNKNLLRKLFYKLKFGVSNL